MGYRTVNQVKASFDDVYTAETPHAYLAKMARHGYEIGEQGRPYCTAAAELLRKLNVDAWPVQMLDVGCSYGVGSAFVRYGCTFDEMVAFFASRAPTDYAAAFTATRMWLNVTPPACDVRCVGLDRSAPAVRFAVEAGLLEGGIARDFETNGLKPSAEEQAWFGSCNLLVCMGAVGYVTERTFLLLLEHLGKDHPGHFGPFSVMTILRMFEVAPIRATFENRGLRFGSVPGVRLPQRRFVNKEERTKVLELLASRGIDTGDWEQRGKYYADLFVAAPPAQYEQLLECMVATRDAVRDSGRAVSYIRR